MDGLLADDYVIQFSPHTGSGGSGGSDSEGDVSPPGPQVLLEHTHELRKASEPHNFPPAMRRAAWRHPQRETSSVATIPAVSPGASPRNSPRGSPRGSPSPSPRHSLATSPRGSPSPSPHHSLATSPCGVRKKIKV